MMIHKLNPLRTASILALTAITVLNLTPGKAFAAIISPENVNAAPAAPAANLLAETREILDRASQIAFQGASAVQKMQTLSMDSATSVLLKNYMASMVYVPQAMAGLPSDKDVMDEPWAVTASNSATTNSDGMVVPHMDDEDEPADVKNMDIDDAPSTAQKFLRLLKPVQNAFITSGFGFRWGRPHQGIDMAAPVGTPIMSAETGKVVYSGWMQGYGNFVAIDHGHGIETHYAHCSKILVHVGQHISKGQMIAKVGSTGHSTGPHLHFEVVANGIHRNPVKFLNQTLTVVSAH